MTKTSHLHLTLAAFIIISATGATTGMAKPPGPVEAIPADDFKPPVFAFSHKTETRALFVIEPKVREWTDPSRPPPPSFYEEQE